MTTYRSPRCGPHALTANTWKSPAEISGPNIRDGNPLRNEPPPVPTAALEAALKIPEPTKAEDRSI
jgi:hypothetical protein